MRIAFITARIPFPPNAGGRIRTFHLLKEISRIQSVTLLTAVEEQEDEGALAALQQSIPQMRVRAVKVPPRNRPLRRLVRALRSPIDPLPYTWAGYRHRRFLAHVRLSLHQGEFEIIHCDHIQVAHTLLGLRTPPRVLNAQNVESLLIRRVAKQESRGWRKALIAWQAKKTLRAELQTFPSFDRCVAVSEIDRAIIELIAPGRPVSIVPNGVDADWFKPSCEPSNPYMMVVTGAMDWFPNIDGITFFVREVLPRIRQRVPLAELWVVGRNPSESLMGRLGGNGVRFTGTVDDVHPYLAWARLVVVPLRIGGGTRLKILEAWAMGKAVVSTSIGAEGLPAVDGVNIVLANTPEAMAEHAVAMLEDQKAGERLGVEGRRTVENHFAWERVADALLQAYEETLTGAGHGAGDRGWETRVHI